MPTVPNYDSPRVRPSPVPDVGVRPVASEEAFGGGRAADNVARQIGGIAGDAMDRRAQEAEKARRDANRMRSYEDIRALNDLEYSAIYDPEKGAINKRGRSALGVPQQLDEVFEKFVKERQKTLANEDQRLAFQGIVEERRDHWKRWANQHVAKQTELADEAEYDASIESAKERASRDPATTAIEGPFIRGLVMERLKKAGLGEEAIAQTVRHHESDMHARVINGMLAREDIAGAKAYLDKVQARMDPDDVNPLIHRLEKNKKETDQRNLALQIEREVFNPANGKDGPPENMIDARGRVWAELHKRKMGNDAELFDNVFSRVSRRFEVEDHARRVAYAERANEAAQMVENGTEVPPDLWGTLKGTDQKTLKRRLEQIAKGQAPQTDTSTFYGLWGEASTNPEKFMSRNLLLYKDRLSESDLKDIIKQQAGMLKKDADAEAKLDGYRSKVNIIEGTLKASGLNQKDDPKRVEDFHRAVDAEIRLKENATGKPVQNEDVQKIVDDLLRKETVQRGGWFAWEWMWKDRTKYAFEDSADAQKALESVPQDERTKIEQALSRNGETVTPDKVLKLYRAKLEKAVK